MFFGLIKEIIRFVKKIQILNFFLDMHLYVVVTNFLLHGDGISFFLGDATGVIANDT